MTTTETHRAFGARVAAFRRERGLTQPELAALVGRTPSWVSQVERGVQPVNRFDVLRLLADALGVSVHKLQPDAPEPSAAPTDSGEPEPANDLDQARLIISGHPAPEVLLTLDAEAMPANLPELGAAVERVWELTHGDQFAQLSDAIGKLLPRLERSVRTAPEGQRPELLLLLTRTYQALAAAFVRQNEPDAAWLAADRAISSAEQSGQPLHVFAGVFRLIHAFIEIKHYDQAEHSATTAVHALQEQAKSPDVAPEVLSLLGALHLMLAVIHARAGNRAKAREETENAREVARRLGEDRNDFNLEFGPTNVEIQAVSTAVDLGDAGEAIEIGSRIDASTRSPERQARLLMDLGRAYIQRKQSGEALDCLLRAEELAPEAIHTHAEAREAIRTLVLLTGRAAPPELKDLAERADAMP